MIALAPTISAVLELQAVGCTEAMTVERMLQDQQFQASLGSGVIVLDEAGMVSGRQMSELLRIAEQSGARLAFSGDTRQIQSVEAGDALRVLETQSRLKKYRTARSATADRPGLPDRNRGTAARPRKRIP